LSSNPFSGEPLLRELAGLWKYKVRRYRLIYKMDPEKPIKLLKKAHLVLGLVEETIVAFINSRPAPIAFIAFDLDYYTSTISAFKPMTSAGRQSSSC
jgi:hypothetical protein